MPARRRVRPGPVNAPRRVPAAGPGRLIKATWAPPRLPDQPTSGSGRGGLPQPHPQVAGPQPASPPAPLSCPLRRPGEPSSAAARRGTPVLPRGVGVGGRRGGRSASGEKAVPPQEGTEAFSGGCEDTWKTVRRQLPWGASLPWKPRC